jgi:hypothetical protein
MTLALAWPLARVGRTVEARQLLEQLESIDNPPVEHMVHTYASLDKELDRARAFEWIHTAIERHNMTVVGLLRVSSIYSELRKDPRWNEVMRHLEAEEAKGRSAGRSSE